MPLDNLFYGFNPAHFEAHGSHFVDTPVLLWVFVIANVATFFSYTLIPLGLVYFVRKRKGLTFNRIFLLFGAFIVLCGIHHLLHALTFWYPIYGIEALNDVLMALVSLGTFIAMLYAVPQALKFRTPQELEHINAMLVAEKKLRVEEESTLRSTLDALNTAALVSMTDTAGNITYVNEKFAEVSKYTREELVGQNHRILKSGYQPQKVFDDLWKTISGGGTWRGEIQNRAKDGTYYWVDTTIVPILDNRHMPTGYMAVRFLITDKKEADLKLQRAYVDTQKFQLAVERSYESIIITDINGTIQYVNPTFTKLTGYGAEEAIGKNPKILQSGKTPRDVYSAMWHMIAQGKTFTTDELINRRKDGTEYYADIAIYPVMGGGKPQFFVAVQRDVTQRKKEERAKADFVSIASHQLRTPLTAIRWSLGRLRKNIPPTIDISSVELLTAAVDASKRMGEVITSMLNLSRLEAGKIHVELSDVHVCEFLEQLRKGLELQYQNKRIIFQLACDDGWTIRTDPHLLHEVISNLLTNAIKYTPAKGTVSLSAQKDADHVTITVADTGLGIPVHQQEMIFTKFFRADNVLSREPDGNGLGLYLVKALTELLGGRVNFTSAEGSGTIFTLVFPISHSPAS